MQFGVVYKITYTPNLNTNFPKYYIGSTTRDLAKYFGSVSSNKWKSWWKSETRKNPQYFHKEVLYVCIDKNIKFLLDAEQQIQESYDVVKNVDYFNMAYAIPNGIFGTDCKSRLGYTASKHTRKLMSQSAKIRANRDRKELVNRMLSARQLISREDNLIQLQHARESFRIKLAENPWLTTYKNMKRIFFSDVTFLSAKYLIDHLKQIGIRSTFLKYIQPKTGNGGKFYCDMTFEQFCILSYYHKGLRKIKNVIYNKFSNIDLIVDICRELLVTPSEQKTIKYKYNIPWRWIYTIEKFIFSCFSKNIPINIETLQQYNWILQNGNTNRN